MKLDELNVLDLAYLEGMVQKCAENKIDPMLFLPVSKDAEGNWIVSEAGYAQPGVRDGSGPAAGSLRREEEGETIGRRLAAGEECPAAEAKATDIRTGTGPASGSFRKEVEGKTIGRRLEAGEECPAVEGAGGLDNLSAEKLAYLEDMIQKLLAAMKDTGDNGIVTEAGANQPGVRDGTGPAKGSFRKEVEGKTIGRRLAAGGPCPATTLAKGVKAPELPVAEGVKMATLLEALRKTKTAAILKQAIITVKGENIGKKGSIVEDILTRAGIV